MKQLHGSFLALLLAGCAGTSSPVGSQYAEAQTPFANGNAIKAARVSPDHKGGNNYRDVRLHGKGGTIEFKPFQSYDVVLPYAPNSLGKKGYQIVELGHYDGWMGGSLPNASPSFAIDWEGILQLNYSPITFGSDNLKMTISGGGLNPKTFYTLFLYTPVPSGGWSLISQTALGRPVKFTLSTPSVLENNYTAPKGATVFALEH